jgi:hypothetical protein
VAQQLGAKKTVHDALILARNVAHLLVGNVVLALAAVQHQVKRIV